MHAEELQENCCLFTWKTRYEIMWHYSAMNNAYKESSSGGDPTRTPLKTNLFKSGAFESTWRAHLHAGGGGRNWLPPSPHHPKKKKKCAATFSFITAPEPRWPHNCQTQWAALVNSETHLLRRWIKRELNALRREVRKKWREKTLLWRRRPHLYFFFFPEFFESFVSML